MFLPTIKAASPELNGMPEILHLFAYKPQMTKHLAAFTQELMRGESDLSVGYREMIAAYTSKANDCHF